MPAYGQSSCRLTSAAILAMATALSVGCFLDESRLRGTRGTDGRPDSDVASDADGAADTGCDADDPACPPGLTRCGDDCLALDSDPNNCGSCGHVCPGNVHAEPACDDGECGLVCAVDWGDCDDDSRNGCETELSRNVEHCGGCRTSCPSPPHGTARCTDGECGSTCDAGFVELAGRCTAFGGAYLFVECEGGTCRNPNLFTGDCSCPPGFSASAPAIRILNDCYDSEFHYVWASLYFCSAPARSPSADWAGGYLRNSSAAGGGCPSPNPYTEACNCPTGTTPIELGAVDDDHRLIWVGLCMSAEPTINFAGAYESSDGGPCLVSHPVTGNCSCPVGSSPFGLRAVARYDWPEGDRGSWGATHTLCIM